jgi:hypothetical protein
MSDSPDEHAADIHRRTDQLLERHKKRIQKLKVTTEETEGLKEKIRAKLEEHKILMENSDNNDNSNNNSNHGNNNYYDDDFQDNYEEEDEDEYPSINQSMNSNASSVYAPVRGQGNSGRDQHSKIEVSIAHRKNACVLIPM